MKQKTAKTVVDVLDWIENTQHHYAATDDEPGFFILRGFENKLRIPNEIQRQTRNLVKPGGAMDHRMYRANAAGLRILKKAKMGPHQ